ncbi:MAG: N-formylglutamate amidohydrolase [Alphaproteobacteria bacterium]
MQSTQTLINASDGPALQTINADGTSNIVLVCEHASNRIPSALETLGLSEDVLQSHAAWDPGAEAIALLLSKSLDAVLVTAGFSRLVYDLNRPPEHPDAMRAVSEVYQIPGNSNLSQRDQQARTERLYLPFHDAVDVVLDRYQAEGRMPVLVTIHTFTPVYLGNKREVELGILHDADARLADELLRVAPGITEFTTLRNAPYGPEDGVAHSLEIHALPRGILNVMLEIRNDLVATAEQQIEVAQIIETLLLSALSELSHPSIQHPVSAGAQA